MLPCNEAKPYIFISYSHKDSNSVVSIIDAMVNRGYNVWYDDGIDPGTEWDENIAEHIKACSYFIAFISQNYLESNNCKDELNYSRDLNKEQLLIYLDDVSLPSGMAMRMNRLQAIWWNKYNNKEMALDKLDTSKGISIARTLSSATAISDSAIVTPVEQKAPIIVTPPSNVKTIESELYQPRNKKRKFGKILIILTILITIAVPSTYIVYTKLLNSVIQVSKWGYSNITMMNDNFLIVTHSNYYYLTDYDGNMLNSVNGMDNEWDSYHIFFEDGWFSLGKNHADGSYTTYLFDDMMNLKMALDDREIFDYRDGLVYSYDESQYYINVVSTNNFMTYERSENNRIMPANNYVVFEPAEAGGLPLIVQSYKLVNNINKNNKESLVSISETPFYNGNLVIAFTDVDSEGWLGCNLLDTEENFVGRGLYNIKTSEFISFPNDYPTVVTNTGSDFSDNNCVFNNYATFKNSDGYVRIYSLSQKDYTTDNLLTCDILFNTTEKYFHVTGTDEKEGFCSSEDMTLTGRWYDDATDFTCGYALVSQDGVISLIDDSFNIVGKVKGATKIAYVKCTFADGLGNDGIAYFTIYGEDGLMHLVTVKPTDED